MHFVFSHGAHFEPTVFIHSCQQSDPVPDTITDSHVGLISNIAWLFGKGEKEEKYIQLYQENMNIHESFSDYSKASRRSTQIPASFNPFKELY